MICPIPGLAQFLENVRGKVTNGEYPAGFLYKMFSAQRSEVRKDREFPLKSILIFNLILLNNTLLLLVAIVGYV